MLSKIKISLSSFMMWFVVIGCQTTDITVGPLKVWEVLTLVASMFFLRRVNRKVLYLFFVFVFIFLISIIISYCSGDVFDDFGGLKTKYYISIARFFELFLCCAITSIVYDFYHRSKISFFFVIYEFIVKNAMFCLFLLGLYIFDCLAGTEIVSYGESHRLKGFYVEGGPLGLYLATLFTLTLFFCKKTKLVVFYFLMVLLCQSKAGYVAMTLSSLLYVIFSVDKLKSFLNPKNTVRFFVFIFSCLLIVVGSVYYFANNYVSDISNIEATLEARSNDKALIMGRIAGSFIGFEMIKKNPILGVGLGNYSLVRNNEIYRQFFPYVDDWDLTGLGGGYNLLVENGLLGVLFFLAWFFYFFKFRDIGIIFPMLFLLPFLLGAQLYMVYPWVYCSFYLIRCYNENYI